MSRTIDMTLTLSIDVREETTIAQARAEMEAAVNTACSQLEGSRFRDRNGAGVSYRVSRVTEL
jgi:hypothetical protein